MVVTGLVDAGDFLLKTGSTATIEHDSHKIAIGLDLMYCFSMFYRFVGVTNC